jgi:hypothetical protein
MVNTDNIEPCLAGEIVMELAGRHGHHTQAAIREAIKDSEGIEIQHQKFSQWCRGESSFPNDFAEIFTRSIGLENTERIELALALSFGQKRNRLLRRAAS